MDKLIKAGEQDRKRINLNEKAEVLEWAEKLGVSPGDIRQAVKTVGDDASKGRLT